MYVYKHIASDLMLIMLKTNIIFFHKFILCKNKTKQFSLIYVINVYINYCV